MISVIEIALVLGWRVPLDIECGSRRRRFHLLAGNLDSDR
jgi:hypothetical protein